MKRNILVAGFFIVCIINNVNSQNINFQSAYNNIEWPNELGVKGGITGDDYSYKRLTLYHGHSIVFQTGLNSPDYHNNRMFINNEGKVGIGTENPDEKLTVKGKIHTQEVRVDMAGPLVPDYVFTNDYKLKTLEEVNDYIKKNNHLPEIPSAQEIEENGFMLAEMNIKLLKKIEEMTLYIIQQDKEIKAQAKEINSFKNVFERLSKIEEKLETK
ncbi:tail fiber protein [Flavobacterium seoulense]|uniref:Uncharacterized protein n=1 Tax=Flavobacterium seoulense TaxID=1492738 RepID=A0A066WL10_9FLAO|nr:tail fiber protein [Flavobacterium seoulense]KDN54702.1 hypothetical protein FEM21_22160 [Flavobacterium seoulense]